MPTYRLVARALAVDEASPAGEERAKAAASPEAPGLAVHVLPNLVISSSRANASVGASVSSCMRSLMLTEVDENCVGKSVLSPLCAKAKLAESGWRELVSRKR